MLSYRCLVFAERCATEALVTVSDYDGSKCFAWLISCECNCMLSSLLKNAKRFFLVDRLSSLTCAISDMTSQADALAKCCMKDYTLTADLGTGYFSTVYSCSRDDVNGVIKIIAKNKFDDFKKTSGTRLFARNEAELLETLSHTGIISLYEWIETKIDVQLVLELAHGGDLLHHILRYGPLAEKECLCMFRTLTVAMHYLHCKDIAHRDLKPENILLLSENYTPGAVKICDFGLAIKSYSNFDCRTVCGTLDYMAPEILMLSSRVSGKPKGDGYGKPVDLWSLGIALYVTLSGEPPFDAEATMEQQILQGDYEFDGPIWKPISIQAMQLIAALIVVQPDIRPTSQQIQDHEWFTNAL